MKYGVLTSLFLLVLIAGPLRGEDESVCYDYATNAIRNNEVNLRLSCGLSGRRWQSDYKNHLSWCLKASAKARHRERERRREDLETCRENRRRAAATAESFMIDPVGNLEGNSALAFLDILEAGIELAKGRYTLSVRTAAPFPSPAEMRGKRFDIIWYVDFDQDRETGQRGGNDLNIHLYLAENGWRAFIAGAKPLGLSVDREKLEIEIDSARARLSFPSSYLPADAFDWWAFCGTINAPEWLPRTVNPATLHATFSIKARSAGTDPHR